MTKGIKFQSYSKPWYRKYPTDIKLNGILPSLAYDFNNKLYFLEGQFRRDIPLTSIRTTNATMFDTNGNLVWAPHNLCTRGQDFSTGWSMGVDGTVTASSSYSPIGTQSYNITWTTASPGAGCAIGSQSSTNTANHTFSVYLRYVNVQWCRVIIYSSSNTANQVRCYVDLLNKTMGTNGPIGSATFVGASVTDVGNGWVRVIVTGSPAFTGTTDASLAISSCVSDGSTVRVGNGATIESANAVYELTSVASPQPWQSNFNTSGTPWYGPRFDYDPKTNVSRGLLIEASRTNLSSIYGEFGQSGYQYGGVANPTQGVTAMGHIFHRATADGVLGQHFCSGGSTTSTPAASTVHTVSVFAKAGTHSLVQLTSSANFITTDTYANFDLSSGTIGTIGAGANNVRMEDFGGGVYRLSISFTTIAVPVGGAASLVYMIGSLTDTRGASVSLSTYVDLFGYQMESGIGATSLIPTFGIASTRAGDDLTITTNTWLNTTKGTIYVNIIREFVATGAGDGLVFAALGTTSTNMMFFTSGFGTNASHRFDIVDTTVTQGQLTTTSTAASLTKRKIAASYEINNFKAVENGGAVATDTIGTVPAITTLAIGKSLTPAAAQMNGWVCEIRYYPDNSASDIQLQALTS